MRFFRKPNLGRASVVMALSVFSLTLLIGLVSPGSHVYAAGAKIEQLQNEAKIYSLYQAVVTNCLPELEPSFDTGGDSSPKNIYAEMFDGGTSDNLNMTVGSHVTKDGVFDCIRDGTTYFPMLGFNEAAEVLDLFYAKVSNNNYEQLSGLNEARILAATVEGFGKELGPDKDITKLSPGAKYYALYENLRTQCGLKEVTSSATYDSISANQKAKIWRVDNGKISDKQIMYSISGDNPEGVISIGYTLSGKSGNGSCILMLRELSTNKPLAQAYADASKADGGKDSITDAPGAGDSGTGSGSGSDESCEAQGGDWSWALCPVLKVTGRALEWVDSALVSLLEVDKDKYTDSDLYDAWAQFRNIGLTLLIAAMLVMVISTALGISAFDAYTVKKAFPRMVAAVIFMLLSWFACITLIDIANVVGRGTLGLMTSPFADSVEGLRLTTIFRASTEGTVVQGTVVLGIGIGLVAIPGALAILLSWVGTALLIMGIAFLTLVARQMFVVVLVLFAPIAILSWIFPGNDKLWKLWWQTFSKLLLMFPMVMALIGSGRIFASVIATTPAGGAEGALLMPLLKLTAYILPYAFIPFTFKAASGVFGNLVGMANDRSKGAFDRLKKGRQKNQAEIGQRMGAGVGFRGPGTKTLNSLGAGVASGPRGWTSSKKRAAIRETKLTALGGEANKNDPMYEANKQNDMYLLARASQTEAKRKIAAAQEKARTATTVEDRAKYTREAEARERALAMAQSSPNNKATQRQAALDLAATGYQLSSGAEGHAELSRISREINGNNNEAHANFMNTAQYNAKGAGRFDLAGLNNGGNYENGVAKASLSELGNGKKESITAMTENIPMDGSTLSTDQAHAALVAHQELSQLVQYSKGANRDEALKQMEELEKSGTLAQAKTIGQQVHVDPTTGMPQTDPTSGKLLTVEANAKRYARVYQQPVPGSP